MAGLTLEATRYGNYVLEAEDGRSILFQLDYDYPPLASNLGASYEDMARTIARDNARYVSNRYGRDGAHGSHVRLMTARRVRAIRRCDHSNTDGTVRCACGIEAGDWIKAATDWLDAHDGESFDNTGYEDILDPVEATEE